MTGSGDPRRQPQSDAATAAREVIAGDPGPASRRWLGLVSLTALVLFVIDTWLVLSGATLLGFDLPVARFVQAFPWGPLAYWMTLTNVTGGLLQDAFGTVVVILLFIYDRRAGWLMALGAIGSLLDAIIKVSIQRRRPTANLLSILNPSNGYSYPSGHAVFFTWLYFMLAVSISPRLRPRWRAALWGGAGLLVFLACAGRVWAGAHWPSDVIGGFLLGVAWCAFVLWVPERWLPAPSWRWAPGRRAGASG
jgi:membrane-associated phospholipid phosphatase